MENSGDKNSLRMKEVLQKAQMQTQTKNILVFAFARFFGVLTVLLAPLFKNIDNTTTRK